MNPKIAVIRSNFTKENHLTKTQILIAELLIQNQSAKQIAKVLQRSHRTIETHIQTMRNKLHCTSKAELAHKLKCILTYC